MPVTKLIAAQHQHEQQEAGRAERAVRGQHRRKDRGFLLGPWLGSLSGGMALTIRERWPQKPPGRRQGLVAPQTALARPPVDQTKPCPRPRNACARRATARRPTSKAPASASLPTQGRGRRAAAMDDRRDRGSVPPLPRRPTPSRRASWSTSIRSRCWSRWCCRRRRPMPASTRRRRRCSRPPTRRRRWWRSARSGCAS